FGFHPMLGFRRRKQAECIAHGCASTIATFHQEAARDGAKPWLDAWGVHGLKAVDAETLKSRTYPSRPALNPRREGKQGGICWFRDALCPFSAEALASSSVLSREEAVLRELPTIYEACGRAETHRPAHAVQQTVE
ncbi:MAG TPA: hypothetical protein VE075_01330, partial [Thermoanaerobaculia bacterium]|nr:hypothetical protein [Thermoanaerobaculia bacterium]